MTRRDLISRKKTELSSGNSISQEMVSIVSDSVQSETQSSSSEVKQKMRK